MHIILASVTLLPDARDAAVAALNACAVQTRREDGCLSYGFYASLENPDDIVSVERWQGQAPIDHHFTTPHLHALLAALGDKVAAAPVIEVHEVARTTGPPGA